MHNRNAFTIVELLVVIIVIAVLVSLAVIGYSGISSKATVTTLQSDLSNAKKQLLAFQASSSTNAFPTAINCVSPSATEICIKPTGSNTFTYNVNNTSNPKTFNLTATNTSNNTKYWINDSSTILTTPDIVTNGLVLHLDAANPQSYPGSGTTWTDLSGSGKNGTIYNGPVFSSANGGSLAFDGVNDYVSFLNPLNQSQLSQVWTVQSFINIQDQASQRLIRGLGLGLYIRYNSPSNSLLYINDAANDYYTYGGQFTNQGWSMVTFRFNSSNGDRQIFRNLSDISTGGPNNTSTPRAQEATFYIGDSGTFVKGSVANMLIYNKYLTNDEISQNFNALRGRYGI